MNRNTFLKEIRKRLKDFNTEEANKIIEYYDELISDYLEDGMDEYEAVESLGDIDNIIAALKANLVIERSESKKTNTFKNFIIILSICTSPVLIPLGIVFFVIFFAILVSLLSIFVSFAFSAIALFTVSIFTSVEMIIQGTDPATILMSLGIQLFLGAFFALLSIAVYNISKVILNFTNKQFSKLLKRRSKKEIKYNV